MHVMKEGGVPHTRDVRGTNYAFISVFPDRIPGRAIILCGARSRRACAIGLRCREKSAAVQRAGLCAGAR